MLHNRFLWLFNQHFHTDVLPDNISDFIEQQKSQQTAHASIPVIKGMDTEKPQNEHGNQKKFINMVSSQASEILSETAFSFSPNEYISIHCKLFQGIYNHAGKIKDYNITKKE